MRRASERVRVRIVNCACNDLLIGILGVVVTFHPPLAPIEILIIYLQGWAIVLSKPSSRRAATS